ncbi:MAG: hypothetical protein ACQEQE_08750 [Bacillota bacterium]
MKKEVTENTKKASSKTGEMIFIKDFYNTYDKNPKLNIKIIYSKLKIFLKNIKRLLTNKKQLLILVFLTVIWIVLTVLKSLNVNNSIIKLLNYLFLINLGLKGGIVQQIGSFISKGIFTYLIFKFLNSPKNTATNFTSGLNKLRKNIFKKQDFKLSRLIFGISLAMILMNFLSGQMYFENSMIGIIVFIQLIKNINKIGGIYNSILKNNSVFKLKNYEQLKSDFALGIVLFYFLSLLNINRLGYLIGVVLFILSIILEFINKSKKEVTINED